MTWPLIRGVAPQVYTIHGFLGQRSDWPKPVAATLRHFDRRNLARAVRVVAVDGLSAATAEALGRPARTIANGVDVAAL